MNDMVRGFDVVLVTSPGGGGGFYLPPHVSFHFPTACLPRPGISRPFSRSLVFCLVTFTLLLRHRDFVLHSRLWPFCAEMILNIELEMHRYDDARYQFVDLSHKSKAHRSFNSQALLYVKCSMLRPNSST